MAHFLTADYIYSPTGWLQDCGLKVENGYVQLCSRTEVAENKATHYNYKGILAPGFINVHCHIELSALKGKIPQHTGMAEFGRRVMQERGKISEPEHGDRIRGALQAAWESGTQALGDICNDSYSFYHSAQFPEIYIHHFIEILGMKPERAGDIILHAQNIAEKRRSMGFSSNSSFTLHAPYSVSSELLLAARNLFDLDTGIRSVHLLESKDEREIFETGAGYFADLYRNLGIEFRGFPTKDPIMYIKNGFNPQDPILFIHLAEATPQDLHILSKIFPKSFFGLCPRSNLFIHDSFPPMIDLLPYSDKICLGTDSLASNHDLDIWREALTIQTRFPKIPLHTLILWLTTNGAKALGLADRFGAFHHTPTDAGVIHIQAYPSDILKNETPIVRLY